MVINLYDKKKELEPHISGEATCIVCGFRWIEVAPTGTVWLECAKCGSEKAIFKFPVIRKNDLHWTCECGNDLFHITQDGTYCPNCGVWQYGF